MGPRRVQLHSEEQDWELGTKQWFWPWFLSPKSFRASSKEKQTRRVPSGPGDPAASPSGRRSCPSGVCKDLSCEHRTLLGRSPRRQKCCSPALESQRARAPCLLAAPRPLPCALLPALAPGLRAPPEAPRAAQTRGGVGGGGYSGDWGQCGAREAGGATRTLLGVSVYSVLKHEHGCQRKPRRVRKHHLLLGALRFRRSCQTGAEGPRGPQGPQGPQGPLLGGAVAEAEVHGGGTQKPGLPRGDLWQTGKDVLRTGQKALAFSTAAQPALPPPCHVTAPLLPRGPLPADVCRNRVESSTGKQWQWAGRRGRAGRFLETGALTLRSSRQQLLFSETTFPAGAIYVPLTPREPAGRGALAPGRQPIRKAFHVGPTGGNEKDVTTSVTQALCPGPPALCPRPGTLRRNVTLGLSVVVVCAEERPTRKQTYSREERVPTRCMSFPQGGGGGNRLCLSLRTSMQ